MDIQNLPKSPNKTPEKGKSRDGDGSDTNVMDIISQLPDEILCHILSLLPTKYAVGTCILSTRWKNLFTHIPNLKLHFDDTLLLHHGDSSSRPLLSFIFFVDKLLNITLRDVPSVSSFCLICKKVEGGHLVGSWVRAALHLNVKRMDIRVRCIRNPIFLIDSLYGCNIVSLNLQVDFADEHISYVFKLPNLKMLSVKGIQFNVVNPLLESCPLLEFLVVSTCFAHPEKTLRVNIPSLKALKVVNRLTYLEAEIEINAPNLEYFNYAGVLVNHYTATRLKSLRIARLDIDRNLSHYPYALEEDAFELIKICSNVEELLISEKLVEMLHQYSHPLPMFRKLVSLAYKNVDSYGWELLPRFIDCAPNLKNVFLKAGFDNESYMCFKASLDKSISTCLSQHRGTCYLLEIHRKEDNRVPSLPNCSTEQRAAEV